MNNIVLLIDNRFSIYHLNVALDDTYFSTIIHGSILLSHGIILKVQDDSVIDQAKMWAKVPYFKPNTKYSLENGWNLKLKWMRQLQSG